MGREHEETFLQRHMDGQDTKRYSTSVVIREMQIQTMWNQLERLSSKSQQVLVKVWVTWNPALLVGLQTGSATTETSMEIPPKCKLELA